MKKAAAPPSTAPNDSDLDDEINQFLNEEGPEAVGGPEEEEEGPPENPEVISIVGKQQRGPVTWNMPAEPDSWDRKIYDRELKDWEYQIEMSMEQRVEALILVGESGVGKSAMITGIAERHLKHPIAYYNAPNMDPFIELVGMPHVHEADPKTKTLALAFVKKSGVETAELMVFDEINRVEASTQNTLFEMVHSRKVNGRKFGNLEMVWGAMNPPHGDSSEEGIKRLAKAFQGRFRHVIPVLAEPVMRHYEKLAEKPVGRGRVDPGVARICLRWWHQLVHNKGEPIAFSEIITPRVLEYMMVSLTVLEDWRNGTFKSVFGELTPKLWDLQFDQITHHKLIGAEEVQEMELPFEQLKAAMKGKELYGVEDLFDDAVGVDQKVAEIKHDREKAKMAAKVIADAMATNRLQPVPLVEFYRIGEFSKMLTAMKPNTAQIPIRSRPEIAGFLAAKCLNDEGLKRAYSKNNPNHPVWKAATPGELAIFNIPALKFAILQGMKKASEMQTQKTPSTGGAKGKP